MIFAVAILLFFAVLIWDLISDYEKWLKERKVNHTKEGWLRATLLLIPTLILISVHPRKTPLTNLPGPVTYHCQLLGLEVNRKQVSFFGQFSCVHLAMSFIS